MYMARGGGGDDWLELLNSDVADDVISWHRHAYSSYLGDFFFGGGTEVRGSTGR